MRHLRHGRIALAFAAALLTLASLLGCGGTHTAEPVGGQIEISITCSTSSSSVAAGSTSPVVITAVVLDRELGAPGYRVQFETDIGDVRPDGVFTNENGIARSNFFPPATPGGFATIRATIISGTEEIVATCEISITASTSNPLLSVSVLTPDELAGLTVTIDYDASVVSLPANGVELLGEFAANDCFSIVDDDGLGRVQIVVTCPTLRMAGGADALRLSFVNVGGTITGIEGFLISCTGVDEAGAVQPTLCSGRVTQI